MARIAGEAKRIAVLGATGSVGRATLDVVRASQGQARAIEINALTSNSNVEELARAALEFRAQFAAVADDRYYGALKEALGGSGVQVGAGPTALREAAACNADMVVSAIVGVAGLEPTVAALRSGADVALANKESMVCGGELLNALARKYGGKIVPVDSEHNAIFQVLDRPERVEKVTLTASGGPFRNQSLEFMRSAKPEQAVKHPNWSMGAKISIDSATMMNKGLELIEAAYLFDLTSEKLDVVVHPQSIVHSLVSYQDGSVLAQMGQPDMRIPISFALAWPDRLRLGDVERLDLAKLGVLEFEEPDLERFPALGLAREALQEGGAAPLVLNSSNEVAVEAYLQGKIRFLDIAEIVGEVRGGAGAGELVSGTCGSPEEIMALDREVRRRTEARVAAATLAAR